MIHADASLDRSIFLGGVSRQHALLTARRLCEGNSPLSSLSISLYLSLSQDMFIICVE